jgi:hypothetical protein
MIFPRIDIAFLNWQQYLHMGVPGYYLPESMALQKTPWTFNSSNTRSLGWDPNRAKRRRPCSGDGGHRRRGPRAGKGLGAYGDPVAPLVEGWGGRKSRARRRPETAAAGSTSTTRLRRWTSTKDLCTRTSESRRTCTCNQLDENMLDHGGSTETEAAAVRKNAGERRWVAVVD